MMKEGILYPTIVTTCTALSNTPFLRTAVAMPSGMEITNTTNIVNRFSRIVLVIGAAIIWETSFLYSVE